MHSSSLKFSPWPRFALWIWLMVLRGWILKLHGAVLSLGSLCLLLCHPPFWSCSWRSGVLESSPECWRVWPMLIPCAKGRCPIPPPHRLHLPFLVFFSPSSHSLSFPLHLFHLQTFSPLQPKVIQLLSMCTALSEMWLFSACRYDNIHCHLDCQLSGNVLDQKAAPEGGLFPGWDSIFLFYSWK